MIHLYGHVGQILLVHQCSRTFENEEEWKKFQGESRTSTCRANLPGHLS